MKTLPANLWTFDGDLYRSDLGHALPLREKYVWHFARISTVSELKATLRAGPVAWPGCYPLYFITSDGAALSFESAMENFHSIAWSIRNKCSDGWRIVGCDVNYDDAELVCDHSGKRIESAYGE